MTHRPPFASSLVLALLISASVGVPGVAHAATYYVAVNGNDAAAGSINAPWGTIRAAVSRLSPGDTLFVRGGTYTGPAQTVDSQSAAVPSGTNFTSGAIVIAGYPGEKAIIRPPEGYHAIRLTVSAPHYLIFQDLTLDGSLQSDPPVNSSGYILYETPELVYCANGAHHVRFQRLDIGNTMMGTIQWSTNGMGAAYSSYLELLDSKIHHAGAATGDSGHGGAGMNNGYGIYTFTDDNLIAGNEFSDNYAIAINAYGSRNTVRNNRIFNNGTRGGTAPAINIGSSSYPGVSRDNLVYNNLIYRNRSGIQVYSNTSATGVYNNTIYANQLEGLHFQYYYSVTARNNIIYANGSSLRDDGGSSVPIYDHNVTSDPSFMNASGGDFRLQSTSSAIDAGTWIAEVTNDIDGAARPAGGGLDVGAYEYITGTSLRAPANLRLASIN